MEVLDWRALNARNRSVLARKAEDPLSYFRFGVPRLKEAFALFASPDPIDELHARGPNGTGKTLTPAMYVTACLQKRQTLDGIKLPQWRGKVKALQFVLDYKQQLLSVKPAYLEALGNWPHKVRNNGDYLHSIRVMPQGGNPTDEREWSVIYFLSEENPDAGRGARADLIHFDEPPPMFFLQEARKAAAAGRRSIRIIGETPEKMREWLPILNDYGETPRRSIRRVDQDRGEVRWSLDEVASWVLSDERKEQMRRAYRNDPLALAREHGDYTNAAGNTPWGKEGLQTLFDMLALAIDFEPKTWRVPRESVTEVSRASTRMFVQGRNLPWPEDLQEVSGALHAALAEVPSNESRAASQRFMSLLCQRLSTPWPVGAATLRDMWEEGRETPRRLLQAFASAVDVSGTSSSIAPGEPVTLDSVTVEVFRQPKAGRKYFVAIDPASGVDDGAHHKAGLHLSEQGSGDLCVRWGGWLAPYSLGVLGATLARQYNEALIAIEMNDHWGANVERGVRDGRMAHKLTYEMRELRPGEWAKEIGWRQNEEAKALQIGQIQEWLAAWRAGVKYANLPSREALQGLIDAELDERGKVVAGPGLEHGFDMILWGQKLRKAVARSNREIPLIDERPKTVDERIAAKIRGTSPPKESPAETGIAWMERPRIGS